MVSHPRLHHAPQAASHVHMHVPLGMQDHEQEPELHAELLLYSKCACVLYIPVICIPQRQTQWSYV